jgi:hypothetical protein
MDILFEQKVVQNTALAAETIWHAVFEAYEGRGRTEGVPFPLAFLILPLTFHKKTALSLANKTRPGALYKALSEDREIVVGLQNRMQSLVTQTFKALSIGFETNLILLDPTHDRAIVPGRKSPPLAHVTDEVKTILNAAKRVGQAIAEMSPEQLTAQLGIRF